MNPAENEARRACIDVVYRFAWHVDHHEYRDAVALFTRDAVFERPDRSFEGHDGIAAMLDARPRARLTRHLCVNVLVDLPSADRAFVRSYTMLVDAPSADNVVPGAPRIALAAEYHDEFRLIADGWKIARRKAVVDASAA